MLCIMKTNARRITTLTAKLMTVYIPKKGIQFPIVEKKSKNP